MLERASEIVRSYDTGVTLRQLFYRLVSEELIPNTQNYYKTLSDRTAAARRDGWFPALIDRTRSIHRDLSFDGADDAREWLRDVYRRDRTEGQPWSIYVGVEKHGIVEQLRAWFGEYGVPILSLGGYSSQTYVDEVAADAAGLGRLAVLIYAGDFDPSGVDIPRDFLDRAGCFHEMRRVALTADQVTEYDLPPQMGKAADSRASAFVERYGRLIQVELDALPPDVLRGFYRDALDDFLDMSAYEESLERERADLEALVGAGKED